MSPYLVRILNLQMRGAGLQRAPNELIEGERLRMSIKDYVAQNPYGLSKFMGKKVVRLYSRYGSKYVILRLFNVH
ncbi:MAG: NAD-dependent epimerase/dehydratase family protein [Candidatus Bathyarchaeia archaeon]